ncbi:SGNH/GDSL hydrolase family protein [Streptomyces sp. SID5910]|nr:SGNH/GDSL hydrolase family protein [Streptomyces sp. SID5910]MYR47312.1 SGNH/GDSL hydrolase family protein [Streptomyces sp. SID5910]
MILAIALSAGVVSAVAPVTAASAADPLRYVALGDSYASAPLVPPADRAEPACLRSLSDYPRVAAEALNAALTDVSCSGATVGHLSTAQHRGVAPQYEALAPDTDIVSITLGGNDSDLFGEALNCVNVLPQPHGTSCADKNTAGGGDRIRARIDAWAPAFGTALDEIARRAPHAGIFVVGYGNYFRPGGCYPDQPYWKKDADYLQGAINHLGAVLRRTAEEHGAVFVDTFTPGIGHDTCAAPSDRWIEGVVPGRPAAPLHPNASGARAVGNALAEAVRGRHT